VLKLNLGCHLLSTAALAGLCAAAVPDAVALKQPAVPEVIKTRPGERLILRAHATGTQIYACALVRRKTQWTLEKAEAELRDERGAVIGQHSAGPSWQYHDASEFRGKTIASVDAPDPQAIPWMLVGAVSHTGGGLFASVTSVQRVNTHGGQSPPASCDFTGGGKEVRVPYRADYYFYAPATDLPTVRRLAGSTLVSILRSQGLDSVDALIEPLANSETRRVSGGDSTWGPSDPLWPTIYAQVRSDLETDKPQIAAALQATQQAETEYLLSVAANLAPEHVKALLTYYDTPPGRRYAALMRELDGVMNSPALALRPPLTAPSAAATQDDKEPLRMLMRSHPARAATAHFDTLRAAGGDPGAGASWSFMLAMTANAHRQQIESIYAQYAADLPAVESFQSTPAAQGLFAAMAQAEVLRSQLVKPYLDELNAIHGRAQPWQASYLSQTNGSIGFSIGGLRYEAPRHYLTAMSEWHGGPQQRVSFKVNFPGFAPLSAQTLACMSAVPAERPSGCLPVEFGVREGASGDLSDEEAFADARRLFHSQAPQAGPSGFELYETGPEDAPVSTLRKSTAQHVLVLQCVRLTGQPGAGQCSNRSRLPNGNVLEYRLDAANLEDAEQIDVGIRTLLTSFTHPGSN
jgi:uncharacterized protein DUF3455